MLLLPPVAVFIYKSALASDKKKKMEKFDGEFRDFLVAVSDALSSGYSVENAFKDAQENILMLHGEKGVIYKDIVEMNTKVQMRVPAEQAFMEFAKKHPTEETLGFAGVFSFARRLGGEYVKNLRRTVEKMEEKLELKQDIRTAVAQKQMEFKVMSIMPMGILAYVKLSSGEFLNAIYGNITGVAIMTICIGVYLVAVLMGRKIVDIRV